MVYKFFDRNVCATHASKFVGRDVKNENMSDKELAEQLHKPIIEKTLIIYSILTFY